MYLNGDKLVVRNDESVFATLNYEGNLVWSNGFTSMFDQETC